MIHVGLLDDNIMTWIVRRSERQDVRKIMQNEYGYEYGSSKFVEKRDRIWNGGANSHRKSCKITREAGTGRSSQCKIM